MNLKSLFSELKRRNVFKVAAVYSVTGWLLIQVTTSVFPAFKFPDWTTQFVIILVLIGFPIALILAWAFELTPDGVKRTDDVPQEQSENKTTGKRLNNAIIIILIIAVGVLSYKLFFMRVPAIESTSSVTEASDSLSIPSESIAVLPFENLSADSSNAYFADGMQDMILTKLANIGDLNVLSRTSTEQYKSHPDDLGTIAKKLKADTFLEGSVQKAGNQVLINVQLIDARNEHHIWAKAYTRTLNNIFGVEGDVAQKIAEALNTKLSPGEKAAVTREPTHNKQAYQALLRAYYYLNQSNRTLDTKELEKSLKSAKQAVRLDSNFEDAYALLAIDYVKHGQVDKADAAVRRALALNPDNSDAHRYLGLIMLNQGKSQDALAEMKKAVILNPNNGANHFDLGLVYDATGQYDKAYISLRRAEQLDPGFNLIRDDLATLALQLRQYAKAREVLTTGVASDPTDIGMATMLARVYIIGWGDLDSAGKVLRAIPVSPDSSAAITLAWYRQYIYARNYNNALSVLEKVSPDKFKEYDLAYYKERTYYLLGDEERSLKAGNRALNAVQTALRNYPKSDNYDRYSLYKKLAYIESYINRRKEALLALKHASDLVMPYDKVGILVTKAKILAHFKNSEKAVAILNKVFQTKGSGEVISPALLKLEEAWNPIRQSTVFKTLIRKYSARKPIAEKQYPDMKREKKAIGHTIN